jgi:Pyruvate/2-oxoacid:ferredoxin oxidoreductase delta subunit
MFFDIRVAGGPAFFGRQPGSMNQSTAAIAAFSVTKPVFQAHAQRRCRECGHQSAEHVGIPDPALAQQLSLIHSGCLDCESCADE